MLRSSKKSYTLIILISLLGILGACALAGYDQDSLDASLLEAAYANEYENVVNFIDMGANVNYKDRTGSTALSWSVSNGNLKMAKLLIKLGANIYATNNGKANLLHLAVSSTVAPPINKPDSEQNVISMAQRHAMVEYLLKRRVNPTMVDEFGSLPIHYAATLRGDLGQHIGLLSLLISHGSPVDKKNNYGFSPLDLSESQEVRSYLKSQLE